MENLERIVASRAHCIKLMEFGINPRAFLWHTVEEDHTFPNDEEGNPVLKYEVCLLLNPEPRLTIYGTIPAWTKAEIDAMIGPGLPKADFYDPEDLSRTTKEIKELMFPIYYPEKCVEMTSGADASAEILIYFIQKGNVSPVEASERHKKLFFNYDT